MALKEMNAQANRKKIIGHQNSHWLDFQFIGHDLLGNV
jgi:hypothetical protein